VRAIVVSAGQGTRLLPLTLHIPKCLVEVNGRTILDHQVEALHAAGIGEIVVVGGYRADQIREHLARCPVGSRATLVINPFWSVGSSIGSVWAARDYLAEPFCLINGDTIFDPAVVSNALADLRPGVNLVVEPITVPGEDDMRVQVRDGQVAAVGKKLPPADSTHRSLGMVLTTGGRAYLEALQAVIEADNGHNAYHHAVIDRLAHTTGVAALATRGGLWCEVDRPEDIERWTQQHGGRPAARALP
jgi:choline kinase